MTITTLKPGSQSGSSSTSYLTVHYRRNHSRSKTCEELGEEGPRDLSTFVGAWKLVEIEPKTRVANDNPVPLKRFDLSENENKTLKIHYRTSVTNLEEEGEGSSSNLTYHHMGTLRNMGVLNGVLVSPINRNILFSEDSNIEKLVMYY